MWTSPTVRACPRTKVRMACSCACVRVPAKAGDITAVVVLRACICTTWEVETKLASADVPPPSVAALAAHVFDFASDASLASSSRAAFAVGRALVGVLPRRRRLAAWRAADGVLHASHPTVLGVLGTSVAAAADGGTPTHGGDGGAGRPRPPDECKM